MSSRCEWRDDNGIDHVWTYKPRDSHLKDRVIGVLLTSIDSHALDADDGKLECAASAARMMMRGEDDGGTDSGR